MQQSNSLPQKRELSCALSKEADFFPISRLDVKILSGCQ
ncbi:Uncharacterised protein [Legionella hackeliae]|nr:Uncharacterised protein [Legionella hackeliae]